MENQEGTEYKKDRGKNGEKVELQLCLWRRIKLIY